MATVEKGMLTVTGRVGGRHCAGKSAIFWKGERQAAK